ncbi:hypothetical protein PHISCL_10612, partial [Aspergillus sclerotialis]
MKAGEVESLAMLSFGNRSYTPNEIVLSAGRRLLERVHRLKHTMAATVVERAMSATGGDPIDDTVYKWNIATQTLCIVFMTLFFGLRVYARSFVLNGFSIED